MSPVKFSNIVFPVWNFVRSLKFYYKTIFGQSSQLKSLEIRLFCRKLKAESNEILQVFSAEIILIQQRSEVNSTEANLTARETQESRDSSPLQRHGYKQSSKLSQLQNIQLNLLTATFLAKLALIFRWWKSIKNRQKIDDYR